MRKRTQPTKPGTQLPRFLDNDNEIFKSFLIEARKYKPLRHHVLAKKIREAQNGDEAAKTEILNSHLLMLVKIARDFRNMKTDIGDLIQEGFLGLEEAIRHYDLTKKVPFVNYASWYIKMKIIKFLWWHQRTVRLPESQRKTIKKLVSVSLRYIQHEGRLPTMDELMDTSRLSKVQVDNFINLFNYGNLGGSTTIDDMAEALAEETDTAPLPDEVLNHKMITEAITKCLDTLHPNHQEFLKEYYGIGRPAKGTTQMALEKGTTTENIRQKRARLVGYLRENCTQMLQPYIDGLKD